MAVTLTLTGPTATSTLTASNARAQTLINNVLYSVNDTATVDAMTDQEKADAFMQEVKTWVLNTANNWKRVDAANTAYDGEVDDDWAE